MEMSSNKHEERESSSNLIYNILKDPDVAIAKKRKAAENRNKDVGGCRPAYGKSFFYEKI